MTRGVFYPAVFPVSSVDNLNTASLTVTQGTSEHPALDLPDLIA